MLKINLRLLRISSSTCDGPLGNNASTRQPASKSGSESAGESSEHSLAGSIAVWLTGWWVYSPADAIAVDLMKTI